MTTSTRDDWPPPGQRPCGVVVQRDGALVSHVWRHYWPDDWADGDTCHCGDWYVMVAPDGGVAIERAPEVDE